MKEFPKGYCEASITTYENHAGAKKHWASGYNMFKADKVHGVLIHPGEKSVIIKAGVEASFTLSRTYSAHVEIEHDGSVKTGHCDCKAGRGGVCKHVAALLWFLLDVVRAGHLYLPDSASCTERPRGWGPGKRVKRGATGSFSDLRFQKHSPGKAAKPARKPAVKAGRVTVTALSLKTLTGRLQQNGMSRMMCDIISEASYQPELSRSLVSITEESQPHISEEEPCAADLRLPLAVLWGSPTDSTTDCCLTLDEAHELELKTRDQADVQLWYEERAKRITASRFGDIVNRKAPVTEKFCVSLFSSRHTASTKHMRMGKDNEASALARYKKAKGVNVYPVGLCVNPGIPTLGASPDGLVWDPDVGEFGLVEVKTLSKAMKQGLTIEIGRAHV